MEPLELSEVSKQKSSQAKSNFIAESALRLDCLWDVSPQIHAEYPSDSLMHYVEYPTIAGKELIWVD